MEKPKRELIDTRHMRRDRRGRSVESDVRRAGAADRSQEAERITQGSGQPKRPLMLARVVLLLAASAVLGAACTQNQASPSAAVATEGAGEESPSVTAAATAGGGDGETASVFDLEVGQCYDAPTGDQVEEVTLIDCAEPHDFEVFALVQHPAGPNEEYPGDEEITAFSEEQCTAEFESYVGRPYDDSELGIFFLSPTAETWPVGDREVVCSAGLEGEQLEGSIEGSDR